MEYRDGYIDARLPDRQPDATTVRTSASFGYEWTAFGTARPEDAAYAEHYLRDLPTDRLAGRIGLDAGCGRGRYARFLAPHLDALLALDGSEAAAVAARNLADLDNTVVMRSDLRSAPVADEGFTFVASLGVLHHLADPRRGFDELVRLLAPGGIMLLYLYSRPEGRGLRQIALCLARAARLVTTRLPHRVLRALSTPIGAALYVAVVLPGRLGQAAHIDALADLPMATYRDKPFRSLVLDTFDRLSAPVEHRFVWPELAPWFSESGLVVDSARDESGWFVVAHRSPASLAG